MALSELRRAIPKTKKMPLGQQLSMLNPWDTYEPLNRNRDYYSYISRGTYFFKDNASEIRKRFGKKPGSFLDIGCGKGGALLSALDLGFRNVTGIEYNQELVTLCKIITKWVRPRAKVEVIHTDYFDWTPTQPYDLVYFFRPPCNPAVYTKFLLKVLTDFPIGQPILSGDYTELRDLHRIKDTKRRFKSVSRDLWEIVEI